MLEPHILEISSERYKNLLRNKWKLFNDALEEKHWNAAKKCLINQAKYIDDNKMNVLSFILGENFYIFLEINTENFSSNEEKKQFLKETRFLRLIDFQLYNESPLDLEQFLPNQNQNENSNNQIFLTQVFLMKKE